jgi:hypothetical protein
MAQGKDGQKGGSGGGGGGGGGKPGGGGGGAGWPSKVPGKDSGAGRDNNPPRAPKK